VWKRSRRRPTLKQALTASLAGSPRLSRLRGIVAARSWRGDIRVGGDTRIGRGVRLVVAPGGSLRVGRGCRVADGCRLVVRAGSIELGADTVLGEGCTLIAREEIRIGERSRLGDGVTILDFGPAPVDPERPIRAQPVHMAAVVLGRDVVVGLRAAIGPGIRLAAGGRVEPGVVLGAITEPLLAGSEPVAAVVGVADGATAGRLGSSLEAAEPIVGGQVAVTGEPTVGDEVAVTGEPTVGDEAAVTREPTVGDEVAVTGEPGPGEEPAVTGEPAAGYELEEI
jgi:acetyltransferase-like isoleucine patch superfamily enzyme